MDNYYLKYEALKVSVMTVSFKGSKSLMFCFNQNTPVKAKNRLLNAHSKLIVNHILINQKRMEDFHKILIRNKNEKNEEISEKVVEFLGNSQVTLNMVQQLNHYYNVISEFKDTRKESYQLSDEIEFNIEWLTACHTGNFGDKNIDILLSKPQFPSKFRGDLMSFRVCFCTLIEFGIRYSKESRF